MSRDDLRDTRRLIGIHVLGVLLLSDPCLQNCRRSGTIHCRSNRRLSSPACLKMARVSCSAWSGSPAKIASAHRSMGLHGVAEPIRLETVEQVHVAHALDRRIDDVGNLIEFRVRRARADRVVQSRHRPPPMRSWSPSIRRPASSRSRHERIAPAPSSVRRSAASRLASPSTNSITW